MVMVPKTEMVRVPICIWTIMKYYWTDRGFESTPAALTKTNLYNIDPLKLNFYIVKLGFTGVYIIFLISTQKH